MNNMLDFYRAVDAHAENKKLRRLLYASLAWNLFQAVAIWLWVL